MAHAQSPTNFGPTSGTRPDRTGFGEKEPGEKFSGGDLGPRFTYSTKKDRGAKGPVLGMALAGLGLFVLVLALMANPAMAEEAGTDVGTNAGSGSGAVTARPVVARPQPATHAPSAVYGQEQGQELPSGGIVVRENKSLDMQVTDELDDYDNEPLQSIADPIEGWNRFWFGFNDIFFLYVAKPAYTAWETITPHQLREGLSNFWHNLLFPMRFVNNLLQFRFLEAGVEFGRFIVNSTAGLGGFADVAKYKKTVVPVHPEGEDFGQTLGRWGIGHGFYIVWPFIGPSSVRETFGWAGDYFLYPGYAAGFVWDAPWYAISGIQVGFFFNDLDDVLPAYTALRDAAVDPYIMMREAWVRHRANQVAR